MVKWEDLKYFKKESTTDKWGDPDRIDKFLLLYLDEFRDAIGTPLIVTSGFRKGDPGQHGLGRAVDVVAPNFGGSLFDLYLIAERFNFSGIGVYRDWLYEGKRVGGLHLDTRMLIGTYKKEFMSARWLCIRPGTQGSLDANSILSVKQVYIPLNHENLRKEGII